MADLEEEVLELQNKIIKLYECHHAHCQVIPQELRDSLNQALGALRISPRQPQLPLTRSTTFRHGQIEPPLSNDHPSNHPSNNTSPELNNLNVIPFNPASLPTDTRKRKREAVNSGPSKTEEPTWKAAGRSFVANAPKAKEGHEKPKEIGVDCSVEQTPLALHSMTTQIEERPQVLADTSLIIGGKEYATQTTTIEKDNERAKQNSQERHRHECTMPLFSVLNTKPSVKELVTKFASLLGSPLYLESITRVNTEEEGVNLFRFKWTEDFESLTCELLKTIVWARVSNTTTVTK